MLERTAAAAAWGREAPARRHQDPLERARPVGKKGKAGKGKKGKGKPKAGGNSKGKLNSMEISAAEWDDSAEWTGDGYETDWDLEYWDQPTEPEVNPATKLSFVRLCMLVPMINRFSPLGLGDSDSEDLNPELPGGGLGSREAAGDGVDSECTNDCISSALAPSFDVAPEIHAYSMHPPVNNSSLLRKRLRLHRQLNEGLRHLRGHSKATKVSV